MRLKTIKHYQGQAIIESLVLFLVFISLFIAIPWLGRLLDISYQQDNASRYGAFQLARQLEGIDEQALKSKFFLNEAHRWRDRKGEKIVTEENVQIYIHRDKKLDDMAQAGQQVEHARTLREQWEIQDKGIATVAVNVTPQYSAQGSQWAALGMDTAFLERLVVPIHRHIAILSDAGHSESDQTTHQRSAQSSLAWQKVAEESYALGRHIQHYAEGVEGFERANPVFDWIMPWSGKIPKHHLSKEK